MATKAMFVLVTLRDGHAQGERSIPAQSKDYAASIGNTKRLIQKLMSNLTPNSTFNKDSAKARSQLIPR